MTVLKQLVERLGKEQVSEAHFEGANVVLYTRDKNLFLNGRDTIKDLAKEFKNVLKFVCCLTCARMKIQRGTLSKKK